MKPGTDVTLTINKMVYKGLGLGEVDGLKIFVNNTIPQDIVKAKIIKRKRQFAEAKLIEITTPSPLREQNPCSHFPTCGGCQIIDVNYLKQLTIKENIINDCLYFFLDKANIPKQPIIPCKNIKHYRNKMDFAFGKNDQNNIILGLKKRGTFDQIVNISTCQLMSEESNAILKTATTFFNNTSLTTWNYTEKTGCLRHLMIRHSKKNDHYMLNLIASTNHPDLYETFATYMQKKHPNITSIYKTISDKLNDSTEGLSPQIIKGDLHLIEHIGNKAFIVSPSSFFQTNSLQAKTLYDTIKKVAHLKKSDTLLDLYCGTGSIGLYLSDHISKIIGVEIVESAIEDAKKNAQLNHVKNATFYCGKVKNILKETPDIKIDCVIVDPPRAGMTPKALKRLLDLNCPQIIYVSCNPSTLCRDLVHFIQKGYQIDTFIPIDMFPNTFHIETVVKCTRVY